MKNVSTAVAADNTAEVDVDSADTSQCGCGRTHSVTAVPSATTPPAPAVLPRPTMARSYVYAIGNIEARFPTLSVEKEFAQAVRGSDTAGLSDQQTFRSVLADRANRYLVRQVCWVLNIRGMDTYLLQPQHPDDYDLLVEAIRPEPSPLDLDAVIGTLGPFATPGMCNGLIVPVVVFEQVYSFDRDALSHAVPRSEDLSDAQNDASVHQVLETILRIADNAGSTDEHRALNYLAMRYADIYTRSSQRFQDDYSLTGVDVQPSALVSDRRIVNCIFTYTHRQTAFTEKDMVSVDVTEQFPFLVTRLQPYFDRV